MEISDYKKADSTYLKENPSWHIEDSPWKATQVLTMLQRNQLHPGSIAEIGCGAGEILKQLHDRMDTSTRLYGYEIAPDAFRFCEQRQSERLRYFQEDLLTTDQHFDLLLMIDVFEHVDDYIGFITRAKEKATYKIYHIPLDISMLSIMTNYPVAARKKVGHLHYFMKDTALATIADTGQEVVDWFYTKGALEVNNKGLSLTGKFLNFLRRLFFKVRPDFAVKTFGGFSLIVLTK